MIFFKKSMFGRHGVSFLKKETYSPFLNTRSKWPRLRLATGFDSLKERGKNAAVSNFIPSSKN
jgi:hypothetical protein